MAEAAARLSPGALARIHRSFRSAKTDALATEVQRATAKGIEHPFIYTELAKFQPLCARGAGGSPDDDEPASKEVAALAKALGRGTAAESQPLLAWTPRHQAYDAWSLAAAVTDQISCAPCQCGRVNATVSMRPCQCDRANTTASIRPCQ